MKKITFTAHVVLIVLITLTQNSIAQIEYKLDSIQQFQYDESLMNLQMTQRTHFTYNNDGTKPTEYLYLKKEMGSWYNDYKLNYTYNSDNNYLNEFYKDWDQANMLWLDITKADYEYDEYQNNTVLTYYEFDNANWNFANRMTSEFNANHQVTIRLFEYAIPMTSEILLNQDLYTYDENGNNTIIENQNWNSSSETWENSQKYQMSYTGNLILQQDTFIWTGGPDWPATPLSRQIYDYTTDDIYNVTFQYDFGSGLMNTNKSFFIFSGDSILEYESFEWDTISNSWNESSKYTYFYDTNGNPYESNQYTWDDDANAYVIQIKYLYFWSEAEPFVLGTSSQELLLTKMYPNPFKDELNILLKSPLESDSSIQIFDIHGKEISNTAIQPGEKLIRLNNRDLFQGLYFIHITSGAEKTVFKAIKQ